MSHDRSKKQPTKKSRYQNPVDDQNLNLFGTEPDSLLSRNQIPLEPLPVVRQTPTPTRSTPPSTVVLSVLSKPPVATRKEIRKSADAAARQQTIREWKDGIGKALCFIGGGMIIGGFTHLNAGLIAFGIICALVGLALIHKAAKEKVAQEKSTSSLFPRVESVDDKKAVQSSSVISFNSPSPVSVK